MTMDLPFEASDDVGLIDQVGPDLLQSYVPVELPVPCLIGKSHAL